MKDDSNLLAYIALTAAAILCVLNWPKKPAGDPIPDAPTGFVTNTVTVTNYTVYKAHPYMEKLSNNNPLWEQAGVDGFAVLQTHISAPTRIQKKGVQEYVFKFYDYREDWIAEAKGIRKDIEDLNSPSVSDSAKTELTRVHEDRWKMMESTVNSMVKGLDESANEFWKRHDITDLNLISDMRALVLPPGKEPWEE
jgi:hypothetical protein